MTLPAIFCPECQTFILSLPQCPQCHWQRPSEQPTRGTLLWQTTLAGELPTPYTTWAATNNLIFTSTQEGARRQTRTGTIWALDARTGEEKWRHVLSPGRVTFHLVAAGDMLFVASEDTGILGARQSQLLALDAGDGEVAWERAIPAHSLSAPALAGQWLFLTASNRLGYAIDLESGSLRWTTSELPLWSPAPPALGQEHFFVGGNDNQIAAVARESGRVSLLYTAADARSWFPTALAAAGDVVYAAGWDRVLYALEVPDGSVRWQVPIGRGASSPPVVGDHVYLGVKETHNGRPAYGLHAYDRDSGEPVWRFTAERHVHTPPLTVDDLVVAGSDDGHLYVLAASDGTLQWSVAATDKIVSVPLHLGDRLLFGTQSGLIQAVSWRETVELEALPDADAYRQEEEWEAAGTVAALAGDYLAAAADYLRAEKPLEAAQLFARAEAWAEAAPLFIETGHLEKGLAAYQASGDRLGEAQTQMALGNYAAAGTLFEALGLADQAASAYEQAGQTARAADCYDRAGQKQKAATLYEALAQYHEAARLYRDQGQIDRAVTMLKEAGAWREAARLVEEADDHVRAGELWLQGKEIREAIRAFRLGGALERALPLAMDIGDWERVRSLAFDLADFEREALACLRLADTAVGEARYERYLDAARALERAARDHEQRGTKSTEEIADLWDRAAASYTDALEPSDGERLRRCRQEARRLRQLPLVNVEISAAGDLVALEYRTLLVKVRNEGYGAARQIYMKVHGGHFEGDLTSTQLIPGLRPRQSYELRLRVRPKAEAIGSAVPLDLELSYLLPNGETFSRPIRGTVAVRRPEPPSAAPQAFPFDTPTPAARARRIYQDSAVEPTEDFSSAPPELRPTMVRYMSESDLRDICHDMSIDFEELAGTRKSDWVRELIIFCEKRGRILELIEYCRRKYPRVDWRP